MMDTLLLPLPNGHRLGSSPTERPVPDDLQRSEARKRAAGEAFFLACEAVLGVEGPAALARVTARSKGWWSKLRSGKGGKFPDWDEVANEVLIDGTDASVQAAIRAHHRDAWLMLHDPELLDEGCSLSKLDISLEQITATCDLAWGAIKRGDHLTAGRCLELLITILLSGRQGLLLPAEQALLDRCTEGLGICRTCAACRK